MILCTYVFSFSHLFNRPPALYASCLRAPCSFRFICARTHTRTYMSPRHHLSIVINITVYCSRHNHIRIKLRNVIMTTQEKWCAFMKNRADRTLNMKKDRRRKGTTYRVSERERDMRYEWVKNNWAWCECLNANEQYYEMKRMRNKSIMPNCGWNHKVC